MASKLKIDEVSCDATGSLTRARVQLSLSGSSRMGVASGRTTESSWQWVVAQATINAVREFIHTHEELTLHGVLETTVAQRPVIVALMTMGSGRDKLFLSGSAPILGYRISACSKAVLHGVNRRIEKYLVPRPNESNGFSLTPLTGVNVERGMYILRQLVELLDSEVAPMEVSFTPCELEILGCLAEGRSNAEIAKQRWISENTVKFHLKNLFRKLRVRDRGQAMMMARAIRRKSDYPATMATLDRSASS